MRTFAVLAFLACFMAFASARQLNQSPTYNTLAEALTAAAGAPNLSILLAAVKAAGVSSSLTNDTAWTILAPTDEAFTSRLQEDLSITPQQLLQPENKDTLVKVLSYHIIPAAALRSSQLTDGQAQKTALADAAPITVHLKDGGVVEFTGATNSANVTVADIVAGKSVVHVIDDVLLPAGMGKGGAPASSGR